MQRVACLYVPTLFLQQVLQANPAWRQQPVAVVAQGQPKAPILCLNAAARALHLKEGMALGAAQAMAHDLQVAPFDSAQASASMDTLWRAMLALTPGVEPDAAHLGVLWLDPSGLDGLFCSLPVWAEAVRQAVVELGFVGHVVVGFNRYLALALARTRPGCHVMPDAEHEATLAQAVPLGALGISPALLSTTSLLGLRRLGDLLQLDAAAVRQRLGAEAELLCRMARGQRAMPLRPKLPAVPYRVSYAAEPPEEDMHRLLFALKTMLAPLLRQVQSQGLAIESIALDLTLAHHAPLQVHLMPAAPTCDVLLWIDLMRLRLMAAGVLAPVCHIQATAHTVAAPSEQMPLVAAGLAGAPKRSLARAAQALARLKAALGEHAVTRAKLCPSHVPEGRFLWQATCDVALPRLVAPVDILPLIRAVRVQPAMLPKGKMDTLQVRGPYRLSHGWWADRVERDYFYVETQGGRIVWLYHDLVRRRWYLHGEVD
jgi:protein ImuB